jgi:hypothetical protein
MKEDLLQGTLICLLKQMDFTTHRDFFKNTDTGRQFAMLAAAV